MVTGIGQVNGSLFPPERARTAVLAYDATVLAGTQVFRNHQKTDRLLGLALKHRMPVVLFAEGGGGRPGDTDMPIVAGLHVPTFASFARLNGQVPAVGTAAGRPVPGHPGPRRRRAPPRPPPETTTRRGGPRRGGRGGPPGSPPR